MSQLPLPPELEALLASWRGRLPIGTELRAYETEDPFNTVILASQPTLSRQQQLAASVRVTRSAIRDHGLLAMAAPALEVLVDRAMRRALPQISINEPAPMIAMMDSGGLIRYDHPMAVDPE